MNSSIHFLALFAIYFVSSFQALAEPQQIRFIQSESRYGYEVELLRHVLKLTEAEFGPAEALEVARGPGSPPLEHYLAQGRFDVAFFPTNPRREQLLSPIQIPLLNGMFGYRLLLIRPEMEPQFAVITSLKEFKKRLIGGVGLRWETFQVFSHNQLLIKAGTKRSQLYNMLMQGELDYFARGVNEIFRELEQFSTYHEKLRICQQIAFYYPSPYYFFVRHEESKLANRLEKGLRMAEADGSFKRIFIKHYREEIDYLRKFPVREVLYLENPAGYQEQTMKFEWWLDEASQTRP